jgi:hypothetical protein
MTEPGSPGFSLAPVSSRTEGRPRAAQEGQKKKRRHVNVPKISQSSQRLANLCQVAPGDWGVCGWEHHPDSLPRDEGPHLTANAFTLSGLIFHTSAHGQSLRLASSDFRVQQNARSVNIDLSLEAALLSRNVLAHSLAPA